MFVMMDIMFVQGVDSPIAFALLVSYIKIKYVVTGCMNALSATNCEVCSYGYGPVVVGASNLCSCNFSV